MSNVRIGNQVARAGIGRPTVNVRTSKGFTSTSTATISAGTPIGLLLALTYATSQGGGSTTSVLVPNVRIA